MYPDLIDWETAAISEPPITANLSDSEIQGLVTKPLIIPSYPCHMQSVERGIRLITEAACSVIGHEARDGFIRQRMLSRKEMGRADSKAAFFPKLEQS